jgi:hypothetical protein
MFLRQYLHTQPATSPRNARRSPSAAESASSPPSWSYQAMSPEYRGCAHVSLQPPSATAARSRTSIGRMPCPRRGRKRGSHGVRSRSSKTACRLVHAHNPIRRTRRAELPLKVCTPMQRVATGRAGSRLGRSRVRSVPRTGNDYADGRIVLTLLNRGDVGVRPCGGFGDHCFELFRHGHTRLVERGAKIVARSIRHDFATRSFLPGGEVREVLPPTFR